MSSILSGVIQWLSALHHIPALLLQSLAFVYFVTKSYVCPVAGSVLVVVVVVVLGVEGGVYVGVVVGIYIPGSLSRTGALPNDTVNKSINPMRR